MTEFKVALMVVLIALASAVSSFGGAAGETLRQQPKSQPLGLPNASPPFTNPTTADRVALGRDLFFDARLSADGRMSCATCHRPDQAFTQTDLPTPRGASGVPLLRNAPTLLNIVYMKLLMHDGEAHSLEAQVLAPLFAPDEMANPSIGDFVAKVAALPDYTGRFEVAFGDRATISNIAKALASYERSLLSGNSPFDRWYYTRVADALSPAAQAGFGLFTGKAGCAACHLIGQANALFTDQGFHNTGIGAVAEVRRLPDRAVDLGREAVTHTPEDRYKFRTPSLRNVARTAPYMHDGSIATLGDVVAFYNVGGLPNRGLDGLIRPLGLTRDETAALVAFLESLTGDEPVGLKFHAR